MITRRWIVGLTVAALLVLSAPAMAKPNFSGNWKMDAAKSDYGPMPAPSVFNRTVKHDEPNLEVETTQSGRQGEITTKLKYTTDGKESLNEIRGVQVKSICKWDGDALAISYKRETPQGDIAVDERWTLSEDSKVTTINSKITGSFGEFEIKTVLIKE